ncbi:hypothetical protein FA95DRAFT_1566006 [Auriscalpium vulgare]|uniref:Uncharacterized protein n=1 Tax=Auriscalpium vulgare TaxID=40419 RepID=A0ACB8R9Y9_9AGAM|nr:hypothetical protein FA95DRAFT_1566006 [Auriscalpium vulgare]
MEGFYSSLTSVMPFQFSQLELTESDLGRADGPGFESLGWVEVVIQRIVYTGTTASEYNPVAPAASIGPVPEKAKKVGWHTVSLAEKRSSARTIVPPRPTKYIDSLDAPYAKFRFRYQPPELLQAHGIMPRGPRAPTPEPEPEPDDPVKRARIRALEESIRSSQAELERLQDGPIKREMSPISLDARHDREVIDLTMDD